jgi:hypothetical protein
MADDHLYDRIGPLDFTRPSMETNSRFVNPRAELGGIATRCNRASRRSARKSRRAR